MKGLVYRSYIITVFNKTQYKLCSKNYRIYISCNYVLFKINAIVKLFMVNKLIVNKIPSQKVYD